MDDKTTMVSTIVAMVGLVVSLSGCATSSKLSAVQMCASEGGTYSTETQTCVTATQAARTAAAMCQAHGGYYDPTAQVCEIGRQ